MVPTRSVLIITLSGALAAGAAPAAARAAGHDAYGPEARPHSRVVTYDHGDVLVRRLQINARRSEHRIRASIRVRMVNHGDHAVRRELRIGRCTGGGLAGPRCPATTTIPVVLPPGRSRSIVRGDVRLRQPDTRYDAIQAALVRPSASASFRAADADAVLLLRGRAWRGSGAGQVYGVAFGDDEAAARRVSLDVPATSPTRAYVHLTWQGTAAPDRSRTSVTRCVAGECAPSRLPADPRRSRPQTFDNRFDFERRGADAVGMITFGPGAAELVSATLPWPG